MAALRRVLHRGELTSAALEIDLLEREAAELKQAAESARSREKHMAGLAAAFGELAVARFRKLADVRALAERLTASGVPAFYAALAGILDRPEPAGQAEGMCVVASADLLAVLNTACMPVRPAPPGSAADEAITRLYEAAEEGS
jgi:hypothetical protein